MPSLPYFSLFYAHLPRWCCLSPDPPSCPRPGTPLHQILPTKAIKLKKRQERRNFLLIIDDVRRKIHILAFKKENQLFYSFFNPPSMCYSLYNTLYNALFNHRRKPYYLLFISDYFHFMLHCMIVWLIIALLHHNLTEVK